MRCSTSFVSLVFKGDRNLNEDQAFKITEFFGFNQTQTEYFLLLVRYARCGSKQLKNYLHDEIVTRQKDALALKNQLSEHQELSEQEKSLFYSDWYYSAVRMGISIPGIDSPHDLSKRFNLPINKVNQVLEFLANAGLIKIENQNLIPGPQKTHLPAESPMIRWRQVQWRIKAFNAMESKRDDDFFLTAPLTCSKKVALEIRERLVQYIKEISDDVTQSNPEELHCLNIDWFKI